jgi:NAD(P)-dependent dehydrogenase (short-subunit alcohol dehydrogenase family)
MTGTKALIGKVALVAGATRGAGRAIALALGEAGATVYCTGRSTRGSLSDMGRRETIDETAELVTARGGVGIPVQVDHTQVDQVEALFERVRVEQKGQLDILINDIWGGDSWLLSEWGKPFWKLDVAKGASMLQRGFFTHVITARYGVPLMVARGQGLVIEITDGYKPDYRGMLFYDLTKASVNRFAYAMSEELRPHGIAALALTPGFLRSEAMLDHFGVTEANWRDGAQKDPYFAGSETPHYVARAVVALASDPNVMAKSGTATASWLLAEEYGFTDVDGSQPHWDRFYAEMQRKQGHST